MTAIAKTASEPEIQRSADDKFLLLLRLRRRDYELAGDADAAREVLRELDALFLTHYPRGTSIVLTLNTFDFVSAANRTDALKAFVARFGANTSGWAFEVDKPVFVGGSAWPI